MRGQPEGHALTAEGTTVAHYRDGAHLEETLSPRPFLHPVRTLGGSVVTDCAPEDHRWHLGVSVAIQDVARRNFWGGRTYVREHGYVWRGDHGAVRHLEYDERGTDRFVERLGWHGPDARLLLTERRSVRSSIVTSEAVTGERGCWLLDFAFTLGNATSEQVALGSPATNGRTGAGYGGFFWRLPRPTVSSEVFTATAEGEGAVHGSRANWLAVRGDDAGVPYTLVFAGADPRTREDPWFVRLADYPGVCSALAFHEALHLQPAEELSRHVRVYVADGELGTTDIEALLARSPYHDVNRSSSRNCE